MLTLITPSSAGGDADPKDEPLTEEAHKAGFKFVDEYKQAVIEAAKQNLSLKEYMQQMINTSLAAGEGMPYTPYTSNAGAAPETKAEPTPYDFTYDQIMAAQNYWDAMRTHTNTQEDLDNLQSAFEGNTQVLNTLLNKIVEQYRTDPTSEFLPASLFQQIMSQSSKNVELKTANTINVDVYLDGELVQRQVSHAMTGSLMRLTIL